MSIIVTGICIATLKEYNGSINDNTLSLPYFEEDKMPTNLMNWPSNLKLKCWVCHNQVGPKFCPIIIRWPSMATKGIACTLNEAKRYILSYRDEDIDPHDINAYIDNLYKGGRFLGLISEDEFIAPSEHFYKKKGYGYDV